MSEYLLGALLRIIQALVSAGPTLLIGLLVAAIVQRLLGYARTRTIFGHGTWRELPQAWLIGMLLPVCSMGVIPVANRLRAAGLAGGTILAFAMTAPLFNPLSLLYGLTLSEPFVILSFAMGSLLVVTGVGSIWDRIYPTIAVAEPEPEELPPGWRRIVGLILFFCREAAGSSLKYIAIGLIGVALLSMILKPGQLQTAAEHKNWHAPLTMTLVAIPAYVTPLTAMWQLGSMFQHGNSIGAAFVLLTLGAGMNLGLLYWMFRHYRWRPGLVFLGILLSIVLAIAYAGEQPLYPKEVDPAGHTHAFDMYCAPFHQGQVNIWDRFQTDVVALFKSLDGTLTGLYLLTVLIGFGLQRFDPNLTLEAKLLSVQPTTTKGFDVVLPGWAIGVTALIGILSFSIAGCYTYYPKAETCFQQMKDAELNIFQASIKMDKEQIEYYKERFDDWSRRLEVGTYLREWDVSAYRRMKATVLRERLELLEHAVEEGDAEEAKEFYHLMGKAYGRLRTAYGL